MELKDKEYTMEELMEMLRNIEDDFIIHIRLEDEDGDNEGSI